MPQYLPTRPPPSVLIPWTLIAAYVIHRLATNIYNISVGANTDFRVHPSPLTTLLPELSSEKTEHLPYPPDAYPGARDVVSPYGSLRVYEWGPEDGRKVFLVHGIANPCIALDLPGRGYSFTPKDTPQSNRLFTTCILLALASSPIPWTGTTNFSLIGYSLGGGIAANFISYFPTLVSSLVLIAPAGLLRRKHLAWKRQLMFDLGLLSQSGIERIVKKRLMQGGPPFLKSSETVTEALEGSDEPKQEGKDNQPEHKEDAKPAISILSKNRPRTTIEHVISWQIAHNPGYIEAYASSMRHGPITKQDADWKRIGERLSKQKESADETAAKEGLQNAKVLIVYGDEDEQIIAGELIEDATRVLGAANIQWHCVEGAKHYLPVSDAGEIVEQIWGFWQG